MRARWSAVAAVAALGLVLTGCSQNPNDPDLVNPETPASPQAVCASGTCTVTFTSSSATWTVPAGVMATQATLDGGDGGSTAMDASGDLNAGGRGAEVTGGLTVSSATPLQVLVGEAGAAGVTGNSAAGGLGGGGAGESGGGGGGGATSVSVSGTTLLVAAGGGGAGGSANASGDPDCTAADLPAGAGGAGDGSGGAGSTACEDVAGSAAGGGTTSSVGSGGGAFTDNNSCASAPVAGGDGTAPGTTTGGAGGAPGTTAGDGGGGGGGGATGGYGGGGGASDTCGELGTGGGGSGGTSFDGGSSGTASIAGKPAAAAAAGQATFTYADPVTPGPASFSDPSGQAYTSASGALLAGASAPAGDTIETEETAELAGANSHIITEPTAEGGTVQIGSETPTPYGYPEVTNNGSFTYTPPAGFNGTDSFDYALAVNDSDGDYVNAVATIEVGDAPSAPGTPTVTPGNGQATVAFTAPTVGTVTSYSVVAHDQTNTAAQAIAATGTSSPVTVTGLTNGDSYEVVVTAYDNSTEGQPSAPSAPFTPSATATAAGGPAVTAVSPAGGPTAGGTSVTVTGTDLTGVTGVDFGSTAATAVADVSATEVTAVAPAEANGTVDVTVTSPAGTSTTSAADHYTYTAPTGPPAAVTPSISAGGRAGSGPVTVRGTAGAKATVTLYARSYGLTTYHLAGSTTSAADGGYSFRPSEPDDTAYVVISDGVSSAIATSTVTDVVSEAVVSRSGRVTVSVTVDPAVGAPVAIVEHDGKLERTVRSGHTVDGGYTVTLTPHGRSVDVQAVVASGDGATGASSPAQTVAVARR